MTDGALTSEGEVVVDVAELEQRLRRELSLTDWRAIVAVVVAEPGLEDTIVSMRSAVLHAHSISEEEVTYYEARRDGVGRTQLSAINRARDTLLKEKRLIWLGASSAADVRFLRETAPDLLSAIDLFVELHVPRESDWSACRQQLCELMKSRHGTLDFTGLLPASVEQRQLPLAELYQPLVDVKSAALRMDPQRDGSTGLLVLGHPGTGKTTFVRHLAWTYARNEGDPLEIGPKVPLLLSLSDYGYERENDRVRTLVDFLPRWLAEQGVGACASLGEHLSEVVLLLDGLDEIRAPEARSAVLNEVGRLLRDGHVGGVVVTGRSFLVDEVRRDDEALRIISTRAAKPEEIQAFLNAFIARRRGPGSNARDLFSRIEADPDLRALAGTPLMLAFMAILDELEGRLPDRKIEIYYRLGEMLVDRWTKARSIGTTELRKERTTRADALRVIGPLAWWTVEQGGGAVSESALAGELERIEARRETPQEAARRASALLDLLRRDTALLVPRPGRRWSFVHSSIGEYFAGIQVERDRQRWDALLADPYRAEWREIVLFCAGQLGVIEGRVESLDALVSAILRESRRAGRYDAQYPSLIIGLLAESPGLSRRQIETLVERLLEFIFTTAFSPTAAFQVHHEFFDSLFKAHGPTAELLGRQLQKCFSRDASLIRWDRLLVSALWDDAPLQTTFNAAMAVIYILGPFIGALYGWARRYDLDLGPTLERWKQEPDWRFRLAEWLVTAPPDQLKRPFVEVAAELGLDPLL